MVESLVAIRDRREQVIARLSECYASDVLDVDELDRRLDLAHGARTVAELDALIADLAAPATSATRGALVIAGSHAIDDPNRAERKKLRVVMSAIERKSRWLVPRHLDVRVFWGAAELDFRDASIGPGTTTLDVRVTMGALDLILPPHLAIDCDVSSFAVASQPRSPGSERHRVASEPDPAMPLLRVVGAVRFGSLAITTRLPGETGGDARRRERKERRARRALPPGRGQM